MKQVAVIAAILILALALAEAAPATKAPKVVKHKQMKVKCKDKYSSCYNKDLYCPVDCPRNCSVNCNSCQAVCGAVTPLPPPPPKVVKPKQVKCKLDKKLYPACHNQKLYCPAACPSNCTVDCAACQPVCGSVVYTPPSPVIVDPFPPPPPEPPVSPAPSVPSPPAIAPSSGASPKYFSRCLNRHYPHCYYRKLICPAACAATCKVDCVTCSPVCDCNRPGAVCEDPKFIGADGLTFYFHGKKEQDFCLVADSNLHINAHFIGKRNVDMGRDFTWVQSLGVLFDSHKLYIGAQKTATWNDAVDRLSLSFDGQLIELSESKGANWESPAGSLTITRSATTNAVEIEAEGKFKIKAVVVPITEKESMIHKYGITQEDCFAHLDLSFKFYSLSGDVNGVLGQTYANNYVSRVKMGVAMPVLGGDKEFHSSSLFSTDCSVARFNGKINESSLEGMEFADLNCASGVSGRGVVCKKR